MRPQRSAGRWLSVRPRCVQAASSQESTCSAARHPGRTAFPPRAPLHRSLSSALLRSPGRPLASVCEHVLEMLGSTAVLPDASPPLSNSCGFCSFSPKRLQVRALAYWPRCAGHPPPSSPSTLASFLAWLGREQIHPLTENCGSARSFCAVRVLSRVLAGQELQERKCRNSQGRPNTFSVLRCVYPKSPRERIRATQTGVFLSQRRLSESVQSPGNVCPSLCPRARVPRQPPAHLCCGTARGLSASLSENALSLASFLRALCSGDGGRRSPARSPGRPARGPAESRGSCPGPWHRLAAAAGEAHIPGHTGFGQRGRGAPRGCVS